MIIIIINVSAACVDFRKFDDNKKIDDDTTVS